MKSPSHARSKSGGPHSSPTHGNDIDIETALGMHPARRPVDIEHDVTDLGQRKRVSNVLTSPVFKEELENVVTDLLKKEEYGFGLGGQTQEFPPMIRGGVFGRGGGLVSPINDLTGSDTSRYTKGEKVARCKLAALYRLVDMFGWSQAIYNHITVRVSQEHEHFLINPYGLLYNEVSASKLVKINMQGEVLDFGTTTLGLNKTGFILHSAIHGFRPDLKCIIHVHTPDVVAVASTTAGFLPISQEALIVGKVSYHAYQGLVVDMKERKRLQKHLGPTNKVMFLKNHGVVACGETIEEAFYMLYHVMLACETQVRVMSLSHLKPEKLQKVDDAVMKEGVQDVIDSEDDYIPHPDVDIKWRTGEMMFEAYMRMIDNMGYRSGYPYRNPITIQKRHRGRSDVEVPATTFGHPEILPEEMERELRSLQSAKDKQMNTDHNSSANHDLSPRIKHKMKNGDGSTHSTPVRDPNQFVPTNTDPREVIEKRNTIRGKGKWDENRPGPQSQLLHGVAPENKQLQHFATDSYLSSAYDNLSNLLSGQTSADGQVAAGSKGIIQRDFQDNVVIAGPPNPFASMTDSELKEYHKKVLGTKEEDQAQLQTDVEAHQEHTTIEAVVETHEEPILTQEEVKVEIKPTEDPPKEEDVPVEKNQDVAPPQEEQETEKVAKDFSGKSADVVDAPVEKMKESKPEAALVKQTAAGDAAPKEKSTKKEEITPEPKEEKPKKESAKETKSGSEKKGVSKKNSTKESGEKSKKRRSLSFLKKKDKKKEKTEN